MTSQARLVGGRYEEGDSLGRGGMADVRKGVDNRLGRTVAIKRLRIDLASDPTFQARFRREAQSAASLNHPSIVSVYDTGEEQDPNGTGITIPYIVMEYVPGKTLREMLREGRKIQPERALEITVGVLDALEYSHTAGIVHRDIKPGNVMLNPYGAVKVMDFGIARAVADTSATMTQTAAVIGTAQYLSPEQARGEVVDARSDLYSTGCLLYELLTGRPPFVGESPVSVAYQHVREEPVAPSSYDPDISPEIDAVVLKSLTKDRDHRYQSAADMRADINRVLAGQQVTAPMAAVAETRVVPAAAAAGAGAAGLAAGSQDDDLIDLRDDEPAAKSRRARGFAYFLLGLAIVAVAVGGYLLWDRNSEPPPPAQIDVPTLINMNQGQAAAELAGVGLKLGKVTPTASSNIAAGLIISQDPKPTAKADPDTAVNITVSAGPAKKNVPNVVGMQVEKAEDALTAAGFTMKENRVNSSETEGKVVKATPDGAQLPGTEITLDVANGKIQLPNVQNMSQADAEKVLRAKGFQIGIKNAASEQAPDTVIQQDPKGGDDAWAEKGTKITLTIAKPPTAPTTTPPPSSATPPPSSETPPPSSETPDPPSITITPPGGEGGGNGDN